MEFQVKVAKLREAKAAMDSSKELCIEDAVKLYDAGKFEAANNRLEKAASYAWGFNRPEGWTK